MSNKVRVAINGFGRIGRQLLKILHEQYNNVIDVRAINNSRSLEMNAHLLNYDSVHGRFPAEIEVRDGIYINGKRLYSLSERDPAKLPWRELEIDIVIECTGVFRTQEKASLHLKSGAKKVVLSSPGKGAVDLTVCMGVNEEQYDPEVHHVISNASCTTNGFAPVAKVLHQHFGITHALMSTIHAYTSSQRLLDGGHKDLRRARSAATNIIPTTTGAAKAVSLVIPELKDKLGGLAFRVPVPTVSVVDLVAQIERDTTVEEVNAVFKAASQSDSWLGDVLGYSEDPLVSSDYIGNPSSSTIDALSTSVNGNLVKVVSWYDNEWGYSTRLADLLYFITERGVKG